jgi:hypothetical protein
MPNSPRIWGMSLEVGSDCLMIGGLLNLLA